MIAIIGILVALLLPAIQAAREAARRTECINKLRNLGIAFHEHHDSQGFFPSGGWGSGWTGDPDQGFGHTQPGSWLFSVMPYIEEQAVYDLGRGQPGWPTPIKKRLALRDAMATPIAIFYCPSRRPAQAYPSKMQSTINWTHGGVPLARGDYVGCVGSVSVVWPRMQATYLNHESFSGWPDLKYFDGIIYMRSEVSIKKVIDGTSKTYMVGEKAMNTAAYLGQPDGLIDAGDDEGYLCGHNGDNVRSTSALPFPDTPGANPYENWGSAHPTGFNMMFADGSARSLSYDIDANTHRALGTRAGGEVAGDL